MAFSPQRLPHRTRRRSDAHQERIPWEPAAAVGRFSLGEEQRGGGAQGVAPIPILLLRLSLGCSLLGRAVSDCWRAAPKLERAGLGWGFVLSSEKEQVKVKLQLM